MLEGCTPFPPEFEQRYIRAGFWRHETISAAIFDAARRRPDSIATIDSSRTLTYLELVEETRRVTGLLLHNGIERGDRIVIQLPNCVEFATFTLACCSIGAIPVMALPAF